MSRRLLACSLPLLFLTTAVPAALAQEGARIAIINMERVIAEAAEGKALREFLQQIETDTRTALDTNSSRVATLRQSAAGLGPDELRRIQHEIEDLQRESQRLADTAQRRASQREDETLRQINERLRPIIQQLIDDGGYDLVLNASIAGVLHASARVDLTPQVIEGLLAQESASSQE